jgi:hypothetical protein
MSVLTHTPDIAHRLAPRAACQPGRFRRLLDSFLEWRLRRVEQEIANSLGITGGHLTDEIERRINERLMSSGGFRG